MKFLGIIFDSKLTFQKHFEDILERCNNRYYRLRLLATKKWGPSPATLIQIYKQCIRPIFEYGSLSTITVSDNIISKIQRLQNKFIRLALRLPKYIIPKLLHDSTGLPYVIGTVWSFCESISSVDLKSLGLCLLVLKQEFNYAYALWRKPERTWFGMLMGNWHHNEINCISH